jgi:molybdopterin converting factor small subunit
MKIAIRYMAQLKMAAGMSGEVLEMPAPTPVGQVLAVLAERHANLRPLLLTVQGHVQPTLLLFLGDEQITAAQAVPRRDGEVLTLLTPMAGG